MADIETEFRALPLPLHCGRGGVGRRRTPKRGEFSWHELAMRDPEAAFSFCCSLFGWEKPMSWTWAEIPLPPLAQ